jgi:hypothetical protein
VLAQSASRIDKEWAIPRRQLKQFWKRLPDLRRMKRLKRHQLPPPRITTSGKLLE